LPRVDEGCAESSAFCRRCCTQTADAGSLAMPQTDTAQMMSAGNLEVMLAVEQSAPNTYMPHTMFK